MADLATELEDPFNFEFKDPPIFTTKKRKKVIGLDDLFNDYKKEQEKKRKGKSKDVKARKASELDDDEASETENKLTEVLRDFKKTICEVDGDDSALDDLGGLQVFGTQRSPSPLVVPQLEGCLLLQKCPNNELNALLDNDSPMGETFLEGLLLNGWLSKLVITSGSLEESIAKWTLNLLLYSSEESLMAWCAIFCDKVDAPLVKVEWLPGLPDLKRALESFGYQLHSSTHILSHVDSSLDGKQSTLTILSMLKIMFA